MSSLLENSFGPTENSDDLPSSSHVATKPEEVVQEGADGETSDNHSLAGEDDSAEETGSQEEENEEEESVRTMQEERREEEKEGKETHHCFFFVCICIEPYVVFSTAEALHALHFCLLPPLSTTNPNPATF